MYSTRAKLLLLLITIPNYLDAVEIPLTVEQLPVITEASSGVQVAFPVYEDFTMKCEATGNPAPVYTWTKNGQQYDPSNDVNVKTTEHSGTFIILPNENISHYDGTYRCYASNQLGTVVSEETKFIVPGVPKFPNEVIPPVVAEEGDSVVLRCDPPQGLSPIHIYWMTLDLVHIPQDERVSVGQDGNLYFANVKTTDNRTDYCCFAAFPVLRTMVQKMPMTLSVHTSNSFNEREPNILTPHGPITVLKGDVLTLECIAEGLPTPEILWQREKAGLPSERTVLENHGKVLRIKDISEPDHGIYRCLAKNPVGSDHRDFHVHVEEAPRWMNKPESSVQNVGSSVVIYCSVSGKPEPEIRWKRNGQPLQSEMLPPNHKVQSKEIIIENLQVSDSAVYQCEATNKHGTLLASASINVLDIAPVTNTPDHENYTMLVGQDAILHCDVFAFPRANVLWYKMPTVTQLYDARHRQYENGSLYIEKTEAQDAGTYTCYASNMRGNITRNAHLTLIEPIRVSLSPENPWIKRSHSITLTCHVHCDTRLLHTLGITWRKDGEEVTESNKRINLIFRTLSISNVTWEDTGTYSCTGHTSMDSMSAETRLSVRDVPSTPEGLHLSEKQKRSVTLSWTASDSHNSPITEYLIQSKKSREEPGSWEDLGKVPGNVTSTILSLKPYYNYEFRVIARNRIGKSSPSASSKIYSTPPAAPDESPRVVYVEADKPNEMTIKWEPLNLEEHNGPGLMYRVSWRQQGAETNWHHENVKHNQILVKNTPAFVAYEVRIQSINEMGAAPEPQGHTLHSGEDTPDTPPSKVAVKVVNSSVVKVSWTGITQDRVRGHLSGYKINYWKVKSLVDGMEHHAEHRVLVFPGPREWGMVPGLSPFSEYKVSVAAYNTQGDGPASPPFTFQTPEGVPDHPRFLRVISSDKNSFALSWAPPRKVNGILKGYLLQHQMINDTDEIGTLRNISITDPSASSWTVPRLQAGTTYKFYLRACTNVGCSRAVSEEGQTMVQATYTDVSQGLATRGWFIGLMCAVALLTLVLLIACFVQRNKGGKYPVMEIEHPQSEVDVHSKKEESFIEYSDVKPLNTSLNSLSLDIKSYDSVDSLVQYSDDEHQQFNEDGSFIGAYIEAKEKSPGEVNETTQQ
ncbi:neural cell adhesion molecule L1-like protein [Pelodytes ibericus]